MIARLIAFLIVLYALGFALYAVTLGDPAADDAPKVDAIVVITGGKGRIEHAASLLADGKGKMSRATHCPASRPPSKPALCSSTRSPRSSLK